MTNLTELKEKIEKGCGYQIDLFHKNVCGNNILCNGYKKNNNLNLEVKYDQ